MKKHLILLPAALIFAASCSGTSGDIPTYTESEFASASAEISMADLGERGYGVERILLTGAEGSGRLLISDAVDVVLTEDNIFMLTADMKVLRLSRDGRMEGYVGVKGNGPGEYLYVNDIYLAPDGNGICLNDIMKGVLTYGLDGTYIGTQEPEAQAQMVYTLADGPYILESVQTVLGNEADRLRIRDTSDRQTGRFANHLLFRLTPKANVTAYQEYKVLFQNGDGEIIFHQMSTDTIFTVHPEVPSIEPRCCFTFRHGIAQSDLSSFTDVWNDIYFVYDYAEDAAFRYVTLMEPGQQKQLYLIDKTDGTIYRSALTFPGSEEAFYPKWQYGDLLIDYCLTDDEDPCLTILRHRN